MSLPPCCEDARKVDPRVGRCAQHGIRHLPEAKVRAWSEQFPTETMRKVAYAFGHMADADTGWILGCSLAWIAKHSEVSRRTLRRYLPLFERYGVITVQRYAMANYAAKLTAKGVDVKPRNRCRAFALRDVSEYRVSFDTVIPANVAFHPWRGP